MARSSARPPTTPAPKTANSSRSRNGREQSPSMSSHDYKSAQRPPPDDLLVAIAEYTANYRVDSPQAYETARYCLMDSLACGFQAMKYPACTRLLGPVVPGATMPGGSRVPGTSYELDPVM